MLARCEAEGTGEVTPGVESGEFAEAGAERGGYDQVDTGGLLVALAAEVAPGKDLQLGFDVAGFAECDLVEHLAEAVAQGHRQIVVGVFEGSHFDLKIALPLEMLYKFASCVSPYASWGPKDRISHSLLRSADEAFGRGLTEGCKAAVFLISLLKPNSATGVAYCGVRLAMRRILALAVTLMVLAACSASKEDGYIPIVDISYARGYDAVCSLFGPSIDETWRKELDQLLPMLENEWEASGSPVLIEL